MVILYNEIRASACEFVEINGRQKVAIKAVGSVADLHGSIRELLLDYNFAFKKSGIDNSTVINIYQGTIFEQLQVWI